MVLPELGNGSDGDGESRVFGITRSVSTPAACAQQLCPLYPAWYVYQTQQLQAWTRAVFVSVLVPHGPEDNAAAIAASVTASVRVGPAGGDGVGTGEPNTTTATVSLAVAAEHGGTRGVVLNAVVANKNTRAPLAWKLKRDR